MIDVTKFHGHGKIRSTTKGGPDHIDFYMDAKAADELYKLNALVKENNLYSLEKICALATFSKGGKPAPHGSIAGECLHVTMDEFWISAYVCETGDGLRSKTFKMADVIDFFGEEYLASNLANPAQDRKMAEAARQIGNHIGRKTMLAWNEDSLASQVIEIVDRVIDKSSAFIVVQEGGSSTEAYIHTHDSLESANGDREECANASYRTSDVIEVPVSLLDHPGFMEVADALAKAHITYDYPEQPSKGQKARM